MTQHRARMRCTSEQRYVDPRARSCVRNSRGNAHCKSLLPAGRQAGAFLATRSRLHRPQATIGSIGVQSEPVPMSNPSSEAAPPTSRSSQAVGLPPAWLNDQQGFPSSALPSADLRAPTSWGDAVAWPVFPVLTIVTPPALQVPQSSWASRRGAGARGSGRRGLCRPSGSGRSSSSRSRRRRCAARVSRSAGTAG